MLNTEPPKLGIVVPIYNAERYLDQCVESILNQEYSDFLLVLVDDGSTDKSGDICDKYSDADKRVSVIHQRNKGMGAARYAGVQLLKTEYITFVDADDWIEKNTYKQLSDYMEKGIDMIFYSLCRYFSEENIIYCKTYHKEGLYNREDIEKKIIPKLMWIPGMHSFGVDPSLCNKIIKRNILAGGMEKVKDMSLTIGEDCAVVWPLFKSINSFYLSKKGMYYHRQRQNGVVAPYIVDLSYNRNLVRLYDYLINEYSTYRECIRQIDWYFAEYAGFRLKIYGDRLVSKKYLFPFASINKGAKIILYGAGEVGKAYFEQISKTSYCNVIAWIDQIQKNIMGRKTISLNEIDKYEEYEYVVVALANEATYLNVRESLIDHGVDEKKLVWNIIEV